MGFLLKTLFILIIIAVIGGFVINQIPSLKQRVIETINPAVKEGRLLGEMKINLDQLESGLDDLPKSPNPADLKTKIKTSKDLLAKSRELLNGISAVNQSNSGLLKQGLTKIIDSFIDKMPFPADHLSPTSNVSAAPVITCSPPSK